MSGVSQFVFDGKTWLDERPSVQAVGSGVSVASSRSNLVIGSYKPGFGTAGLLTSASQLTQVSGPQTFNQVGTASSPYVVQNKQFNDRVSVNGKHIVFRNCYFRGSATENRDCITSTNAGCLGIRFEDCLIKPQHPQWAVAAVRGGHHTTFLRCEVRGAIDGIAHTNSGGHSGDQAMRIYGCWFHDMAYFSPDPGAAGGKYDNASHVDLVQLRGGGGFHFKGNNFDGFLDPNIGQADVPSVDRPEYDSDGNPTGRTLHITGNKYWPNLATTSVVMLSPALNQITGFKFEHNWVNGGSYSINFGDHTNGSNIAITNNRWGRGMRCGPTATVIAKSNLPITLDGNTFWDNNADADIRKAG